MSEPVSDVTGMAFRRSRKRAAAILMAWQVYAANATEERLADQHWRCKALSTAFGTFRWLDPLQHDCRRLQQVRLEYQTSSF